MANGEINEPDFNELGIYEGGSLNEISCSDLVNNEIAIRQLINNYNLKIKESARLQREIGTLKSDLEYQKTSPFISIIAMLVNIVGTIIVGYGVNLLSASDAGLPSTTFIVLGGILIVVSNLSTILYRWAKEWFNPLSN